MRDFRSALATRVFAAVVGSTTRTIFPKLIVCFRLIVDHKQNSVILPRNYG